MKKIWSTLAHLLIVVGILGAVEAAVTLLWKEPFTAFYTARVQDALGDELDQLREREQELRNRLKSANKRKVEQYIEERAASLTSQARIGKPIGELKIDAIGLDSVVVQGTDDPTIRKGPGHYSETPLPGLKGNWTSGIAGHRSTYSAPFRDIDDLEHGDEIVVEMPYARFYYTMQTTQIVDRDYRAAFRRRGYDRLALTACHPRDSNAQRIIAYAKLDRTEPLAEAEGAGLAG